MIIENKSQEKLIRSDLDIRNNDVMMTEYP